MSMVNKVENILKNTTIVTNASINPEEFSKLLESLEKLSPNVNKKKGYTLPQIDTIGAKLHDNLECSIKNI